MPLRVSGIRLAVDAGPAEVRAAALRRARIADADVASLDVVRRSLDRRHGDLVLVYTVDLHLAEGRRRPVAALPGTEWIEPAEPEADVRGEEPLEGRPVIVGSGPAGLFAALRLARAGFKPLVLERGDAMNGRIQRIRDINRSGILDPESNYLFGEGGAGTFSDGKLTSRSSDPRCGFVLDEFRRKSGVASVVWDYRPHLGSDRVRAVVGRLRREIQELGGEFRFRCRVTGLLLARGALAGVATSEGDVPARVVILGAGHSARDLTRALAAQGVPMEPRAFQLGLRVEHPQEFVDRAVHGAWAGHAALGPADYRLAFRAGPATVFSFCMCPGGEIIPAVSDLGHMNTNGMSWSHKATGFANSGIVTTLEPAAFGGEGVFAGIELQERFEARAAELVGGRLTVPGQRLGDYLAGRPGADLPKSSCRSGVAAADLREVVPPDVDRLLRTALAGMERQMRGFLHPEALLVGPESRSSSPVRFRRDPVTLESPGVPGLHPVGEGAGFAGGIVSAAADGLRAAEAVIRRYRPASSATA